MYRGLCLEKQVTFIMDEDPNIILADSPMTYMLGYRYSNQSLELSLENRGELSREPGSRN
jgi:predicted metallo-beta-lactamase superfamily hydrolase